MNVTENVTMAITESVTATVAATANVAITATGLYGAAVLSNMYGAMLLCAALSVYVRKSM